MPSVVKVLSPYSCLTELMRTMDKEWYGRSETLRFIQVRLTQEAITKFNMKTCCLLEPYKDILGCAAQPNFFMQKVLKQGYAKELNHIGYTVLVFPTKKF